MKKKREKQEWPGLQPYTVIRELWDSLAGLPEDAVSRATSSRYNKDHMNLQQMEPELATRWINIMNMTLPSRCEMHGRYMYNRDQTPLRFLPSEARDKRWSWMSKMELDEQDFPQDEYGFYPLHSRYNRDTTGL